MHNYVTIKKFSEISGYSEDAIRTKIRDGVWFENKVWVKAPDGRNLISIDGYHDWVEQGLLHTKRQKRVTKSPIPIENKITNSKSFSSPEPLIT